MDKKAVNTNRYYLSGNLQNVLDSKQIICYCINIQLLHGEDKMQRYHYPLEDGFTERIHTPGGVRSLVEGFNVDGPLAELTALINYVTSSQMSMRDLQTHLDYCAEQLRKQTR